MINNLDINKVIVSNAFTFSKQDFNYYIGYKDNKEIRPLCIFFPEMSRFKRYSNKTKYMCFMIEDEKSCDKYMKIWEKFSHVLKTNFNSELIYNKTHLKPEKRFNTKKLSTFIYTNKFF